MFTVVEKVFCTETEALAPAAVAEMVAKEHAGVARKAAIYTIDQLVSEMT